MLTAPPKPPAFQCLILINEKLRVFVSPNMDKAKLRGMLEMAIDQVKEGAVDGALNAEIVFDVPEDSGIVTGNENDVTNAVAAMKELVH